MEGKLTYNIKSAANLTPNSQRFLGKSVLITGGAGGMGLAATRMFAAEGAEVSVLDVSHDAGQAMIQDMSEKGYDVFFEQADLSKSKEINAGIDAVLSKRRLEMTQADFSEQLRKIIHLCHPVSASLPKARDHH